MKALTITTKLLIEQHIHGAFGVDFNKAEENEIRYVSAKLLERGIGGFFPTLVTDSVDNIKRQVSVLKQAALSVEGAKILGIHLEGIFINPAKKGIHNPNHFLPAAIKDYKLFEDDFIKIVTMAPEFDKGLLPYLRSKGVKVQAGHCVTGDLSNVDGVTHLFNAMTGISHRGENTALSALNNDEIYTELIADGVHLSDEILKLTFKCKPSDRIILISDALPITHSDISETIFADEKIFYDGKSATSAAGTIAGSTTLLDGIIKRLHCLGLMNLDFIDNPYNYHNIDLDGEIIWDDDFNILEVKY